MAGRFATRHGRINAAFPMVHAYPPWRLKNLPGWRLATMAAGEHCGRATLDAARRCKESAAERAANDTVWPAPYMYSLRLYEDFTQPVKGLVKAQ